MTDKGVSAEGATFSEDDGRFLITTSDGSEYELLTNWRTTPLWLRKPTGPRDWLPNT